MKRRTVFSFSILAIIVGLSLLTAHRVIAAQISYPIGELGGCRDAKECYLYCQIPQNTPACWSYGKYVLKKDVLGEQTASEQEMAKKYNISFPITELGNCSSITACKAYCENPSNQEACLSFAKKKGFYKEVQIQQQAVPPSENKQDLLEKAKTELGCTSMESCRTYCETNHDVCMQFAKKHGLHQPQDETKKDELLQKAKEELGCTSMESCRTYCEAHSQACMDFAKKHNMNQEHREYPNPSQKPGNCDSEASCKKYCEEHQDQCKGFRAQQQVSCKPRPSCLNAQPACKLPEPAEGWCSTGETYRNTEQGEYLGPSGCKTETECKAYCESHPSECPGYQQNKQNETKSSYPTYQPATQEQYQQSTTQTYPTP